MRHYLIFSILRPQLIPKIFSKSSDPRLVKNNPTTRISTNISISVRYIYCELFIRLFLEMKNFTGKWSEKNKTIVRFLFLYYVTQQWAPTLEEVEEELKLNRWGFPEGFRQRSKASGNGYIMTEFCFAGISLTKQKAKKNSTRNYFVSNSMKETRNPIMLRVLLGWI